MAHIIDEITQLPRGEVRIHKAAGGSSSLCSTDDLIEVASSYAWFVDASVRLHFAENEHARAIHQSDFDNALGRALEILNQASDDSIYELERMWAAFLKEQKSLAQPQHLVL